MFDLWSRKIPHLTWQLAFPGGSVVKNLPANVGDAGNEGSVPGSVSVLEEEMATHFTILPKMSHGHSSLAGYSP